MPSCGAPSCDAPWRAYLPWAPYLLVSAWHLYGTLPGVTGVAGPTKGLLMPLLLVTLLQSVPHAVNRLTLVAAAAVVLSWLGDITIGTFLVGLSFFLLAQVVYTVLFGRLKGRRRPWAWGVFAYCAALCVWLVPHTGSMAVPVVLYAVAIASMAFFAAGVNTVTFVGAAFFVLSDSLLAVNRFVSTVEVPYSDFLVMATYLLGQGLIVLGVGRRLRAMGERPRTPPTFDPPEPVA